MYHTLTDMQRVHMLAAADRCVFPNNDLCACWLVKLSHNAQPIRERTIH
jgi:hypothetical protein